MIEESVAEPLVARRLREASAYGTDY